MRVAILLLIFAATILLVLWWLSTLLSDRKRGICYALFELFLSLLS